MLNFWTQNKGREWGSFKLTKYIACYIHKSIHYFNSIFKQRFGNHNSQHMAKKLDQQDIQVVIINLL